MVAVPSIPGAKHVSFTRQHGHVKFEGLTIFTEDLYELRRLLNGHRRRDVYCKEILLENNLKLKFFC